MERNNVSKRLAFDLNFLQEKQMNEINSGAKKYSTDIWNWHPSINLITISLNLRLGKSLCFQRRSPSPVWIYLPSHIGPLYRTESASSFLFKSSLYLRRDLVAKKWQITDPINLRRQASGSRYNFVYLCSWPSWQWTNLSSIVITCVLGESTKLLESSQQSM